MRKAICASAVAVILGGIFRCLNAIAPFRITGRARDSFGNHLDPFLSKTGTRQEAADGACGVMAAALFWLGAGDQRGGGNMLDAIKQVMVADVGRFAIFFPDDRFAAFMHRAGKYRLRAFVAADPQLAQC